MDHSKAHHGLAGGLDQDLGCPGCGYNLRGLGSDVVICPECGLGSDVGQLLVRRWDKPWYRAPKYHQLCMPAAAALLACLGWVFSIAVIDAELWEITYAMAGAIWIGIGLVCWCTAMVWVWNKLDGFVSAGFALLVHLLVIGYIGGLVFFLFGAGTLILLVIDGEDAYPDSDLGSLIAYTLFLVGGLVAIVLARLIDRIAAKHCIRMYLRRPTTSG